MRKSKTPSPFDVKMSDEELSQLGGDLAREIEDALTARAEVIENGGLIDVADWFYEQGRSQPSERPFPGAADLTSYFITENVSALRARIMKAVFGVRPVAFAEGWGRDAQKAPFVEEFTDWQVRKSDLRSELGRVAHGALLEDGYILEVSEKVETRKVTETRHVKLALHPETNGPIFEPDDKGKPQPKLQTDPETGEPLDAELDDAGQPTEPAAQVQRTYIKTKRLGPQYDPISMKDFVFLPGHAKSEKQVYGYAYRFWKRLPELREAAADGVYDADQVTALGEESDRELTTVPPPVNDVQAQYGDAREKELFQISLKRDLDDDGREEWYVATVSLKTRTLLRLKLDAFAQRVGRSRCVLFNLFPRRNSVYGYSYAFDMLLTLAEEHTGVRNMKADRSALATNAPMTQLTGGLWDPEAQPIGVGRIIQVRDHNEIKQLQIPDVPASIIQSEQMLHIAKERVGGLSDSASGVLSAERRTLGEQKLVAGGSAVRVDEVIGHFQMALADVLKLTLAVWQDTLRADPKGVDAPPSVIGALQARMPDFQGTFTADQLTGDFQFEPYGSDELADPQKRRADFDSGFIALANLAKVVPGLGVILNSPDVAKATLEQWLRAYNVRDRQPFLGAFNAPPVPAAAGGPGSEAMGGPPAGPLPPGMPSGIPVPGAMNPNIGALMATLAGGGHG